MVKGVAAILSCVLLFGCCKDVVREKPVIVEAKVPVIVEAPKIEKPPRPQLEINTLTESDKADRAKVGKAYVNSVNRLEKHIEELEMLIDGANDNGKKKE